MYTTCLVWFVVFILSLSIDYPTLLVTDGDHGMLEESYPQSRLKLEVLSEFSIQYI